MVTRRALHIDEPKTRCDDRAIQILVPNCLLKLDRILRKISLAARTPNPQIKPHSSTGARYATPAEDRSLCLVGCSIWNFSKRTPHNFENLHELDCESSQQHILLMSRPTLWRPKISLLGCSHKDLSLHTVISVTWRKAPSETLVVTC